MEGYLLRRLAIIALAALLFAVAPRLTPIAGTLSTSVVPAPGTPHAPILIDGNAAFTSANGVVSGQGTAAKPYLIENWAISAANATGVDVRNTTSYFEILDVQVCCGGSAHDGIDFTNVNHGSAVGTTVAGSNRGLLLYNSQNVSVSGGGYAGLSDAVDVWYSDFVNVSGAVLTPNAAYGVWANVAYGLDLWYDVITGAPSAGVELTGSSSVRVGYTTINGTGPGIDSDVVATVVVSHNVITSTASSGILLPGANFATITGNTVNVSSAVVYGVLLGGSNDTLSANTIRAGGGPGVLVPGGSGYISVLNNRIAGAADYAVELDGSTHDTVRGNDLTGDDRGILVSSSWYADIEANTFSKNGILLAGPYPDYYRTHTITPDNLIGGKPVLYTKDCASASFDGVAAGEILVANCTTVRVAHETIDGTGVGVEAAFVGNASLANDSVANATGYGAYLFTVGNASLANDTFRADNVSVFALYVGSVRVVDTTIRDVVFGLQDFGGRLDLERDAFLHDGLGADLLSVTGGLVANNRFVSDGTYVLPSAWAIYASGAANLTVTRNLFLNNTGGIRLSGSSGFLTYANNFTANGQAAWDDAAAGVNSWDEGYPTGGNYWSDYRGWDDCHGIAQNLCTYGDGLGDIPYTLPSGQLDHYPLVYVNPPKVWPVANINATAPFVVGTAVAFDGTGSYDPTGWPLKAYRWTFGDGANATVAAPSHTYMSAGIYIVTLTVTSLRGLTNATSMTIAVQSAPPPPTIALVNWSSSHGYTVPVPAAWSRQYNVTLGNTTYDLELLGTVNGTAADMIVGTFVDTKAQETNAYLTAQIQAAMQSLQATYPDAYLGTTTQFTQVSGHLAATFEIDFSAHPIFEDVLLIVSAAHQRDWTVVLAGSTSQHTLLSGAFSRIVSGFVITLAAPTTGGGATNGPPADIWTFAQILGPVVLIVVVVLVLLTRKRKPAGPPAPSPYVCARCGTPRAIGAKFCGRCGTPFPVEMYLPPPGPPGV